MPPQRSVSSRYYEFVVFCTVRGSEGQVEKIRAMFLSTGRSDRTGQLHHDHWSLRRRAGSSPRVGNDGAGRLCADYWHAALRLRPAAPAIRRMQPRIKPRSLCETVGQELTCEIADRERGVGGFRSVCWRAQAFPPNERKASRAQKKKTKETEET